MSSKKVVWIPLRHLILDDHPLKITCNHRVGDLVGTEPEKPAPGDRAQAGQRIEVLVSEWWQDVHSEATVAVAFVFSPGGRGENATSSMDATDTGDGPTA